MSNGSYTNQINSERIPLPTEKEILDILKASNPAVYQKALELIDQYYKRIDPSLPEQQACFNAYRECIIRLDDSFNLMNTLASLKDLKEACPKKGELT